jgi:chromosome partitioning protein
VNVAHALTAHGRVLLIDIDAQAHASIILGAVPETHITILEVLENSLPLQDAINPSRIAGLDIVYSSRNLGAYELSAGGNDEQSLILAEQVATIQSSYDYIVIDPPPTLGILMVTSLIAAREVYIPMPMHFLAMEGLAEMMQVIYRLNASLNPTLRLSGIVPTFYNQKTKIARKISAEIKVNFGAKMIMPGIRNNITLAESPAYKQTIFEYAPKSHGAVDYRNLVEKGILKGILEG